MVVSLQQHNFHQSTQKIAQNWASNLTFVYHLSRLLIIFILQMELNEKKLHHIKEQLNGLSVSDALHWWCSQYPKQVAFSTSFSMEDQVILFDIMQQQLPITIFTLDTGRLFAETYSVWSNTIEKYGATIETYYPDAEMLQTFVSANGPNAFYTSTDLRKQCCHIRKVEPLKKALTGKKVWITGLRAEHSANRNNMPAVEWDAQHQVFKFHPLLHWTTTDIKYYINTHHIPYNPLHDKGFISIGCAPCTRAIKPGEDFRAGRWWWEDASKKECGLHVK
jgi:phosphoadenosine phosphosulfate reductase